jgi:hypothetical protein
VTARAAPIEQTMNPKAASTRRRVRALRAARDPVPAKRRIGY